MLSRLSRTVSNRIAPLFGAAVIGVAAWTPAEAGEATWGPWESLGGRLSNSSLPECRRQGGTIDCWALSPAVSPSPGNNLVWLRGDGETWAEWVNLGGALRAAPECVSRGDEIDCFGAAVATQGSQLAHIAYDGRDWGNWEPLGGSVKQKPACLAGPGQEITCLALAFSATLTADGVGLWYYRFDGQAWQPATLIAFPDGVTSSLRPMCTDTARGTQCFTVDKAAQLWTILRDKDGVWGNWEPLAPGIGIGETPHCLASGIKLDCFSKSKSGAETNGRLISASFNGRTWSQWLEVGDKTLQSQPYCNELGSGFDCYWTSPPAAGGELRRRQLDHSTWRPEENLGGAVKFRPECLATPGGQRIDCFAQGTDNTLHHRAFD